MSDERRHYGAKRDRRGVEIQEAGEEELRDLESSKGGFQRLTGKGSPERVREYYQSPGRDGKNCPTEEKKNEIMQILSPDVLPQSTATAFSQSTSGESA